MNCPACKTPIQPHWRNCAACGASLSPVASAPGAPNNPYASPVRAPGASLQAPASDDEGDATGGLIPYKNPKALIAYYLGIGSMFPLLGLPLGIGAFVLGIMGLRDRSRRPKIRGAVHAGIGIGCGFISVVLWSVMGIMIVYALLAKAP